jgi:hypothetical protein
MDFKKIIQEKHYMSGNLIIKKREYLDNEMCIDLEIVLFSKESLSPFGNNENFIWEGSYKDQKIKVTLARGDHYDFAKIEKPDDLNISDQITQEIRRVLRDLN